MDALIERYNTRLMGAAQKIAADRTIPVKERIVGMVMALNLDEAGAGSGREIMEHIHKPQNALMHQKIQKIIINGVTPILTGIIREGIEQGLFNTPFPYECTEMIVAYANTVFDEDMVEMTVGERASRIQAFIFNSERLLGVETGSLKYFARMFDSETGGRHA